jgi:hypothetical protein
MKKNRIILSIFIAALTLHCSLFIPISDSNTHTGENFPEIPGVNPPADSPRNATITEVIPTVESRDTGEESFAPATTGERVNEGGQVRTGYDGKAKIEIFPERTVVRISNNTIFTLTELQAEGASPTTRLQLILGDLWIILNGGELDVETSSGEAAVSGSMMSVGYNADSGAMVVTCLEGHCSLSNEFGTTVMVGGDAAEIPDVNLPPTAPRPLSPQEIQRWEDEMPEANSFLENAPPPPSGPGGEPGWPGEPPPNGSEHPDVAPGMSGPLKYSFTNQCYYTWHWSFTGPVTEQIDIKQGESVSGELPPGVYSVTDWDDHGFFNGPYEVLGGGFLEVTRDCPGPDDSNPPPDAQPADNPPPAP